VAVLCVPSLANAQRVVGFEDIPLAPESYYNGSDGGGCIMSGGLHFNNVYDPTFGTWSGWSVSNVTDVVTPGFGNQYAAYHLPNGGGDQSSNFAVAFNFSEGDAMIDLPRGRLPRSLRITNTTYTALSMKHGDAFAKKFGGPSGTDPDFFHLTIRGLDKFGNVSGTVSFYLADYRFENNAQDYIIDEWTAVNLVPLGNAKRLVFELTSSDNHPDFGMNTPAYFAIDNLVTRPEGP
jgi:hypothetical protein